MILLIADSVCGGFGQLDRKSFIHYSAKKAGLDIWDHSASGMSSRDYLGYMKNGRKFSNDQDDEFSLKDISLVVISLGNVDAKGIFKNNNLFSLFVPNRYRFEKIDPRPYFSDRVYKKVPQVVDNIFRGVFRWYSYCTGNLSPAVDLDEYDRNIKEILGIFTEKPVVLISTSLVDGFGFPGSPARFDQVNNILKEISARDGVEYFDFRPAIDPKMLLKDKFHLNSEGHRALVSKFYDFLVKDVS